MGHAYPLERFLDRLREAGLPSDARTLIRLQQAMQHLGGGYAQRPEELWQIIAPIVARNREEQEKVRLLWEQYLHERQATTGPAEIVGKAASSLEKRRRALLLKKWLIIGSCFVAVVAVISMLVYTYKPAKFPPMHLVVQDSARTLTSKDTARIRVAGLDDCGGCTVLWDTLSIAAAGLRRLPSPPDQCWLVPDSAPASLGIGATVQYNKLWKTHQQYLQPLHHQGFICEGHPLRNSIETDWQTNPDAQGGILASFTWEHDGTDSFEVRWAFGDGDTAWGNPVEHTYDSASTYAVRVDAYPRSHPWCRSVEQATTINLSLQYPNKPPLPPLTSLTATVGTWKRLRIGYGLALLWILVGAVGMSWIQMNRRHRVAKAKAVEDANRLPSIDTGGPYRIPWPNQDHHLAWGGDIDRIASLMAGRISGDRMVLDVPRSLRATVAKGGFPTPAFRNLGEQQQWLFLLDEGSMSPHLRQLFAWLMARLASETVNVHAYCYNGSPSHCWSLQHGNVLTLDAISGLHAKAHLVIVSDAAGLMDPFREELRPSVEDALKAWPRRTLMPLRPVREWATRERVLSTFMGICPMDAAGWLEYLLQAPQDGLEYSLWRKHLLKLQKEQVRWPRDPDTVQEVTDELGDGLFSRWLRALLALPEFSYELLLATGAAVKESQLTWDDLVQFLRFPLLARQLPTAAQLDLPTHDPWFILGNREAEKLLAQSGEILAERGQQGHASTLVRRNLAVTQYRQNPADEALQRELLAWQRAGLHPQEVATLPPVIPPKVGRVRNWILLIVASIMGIGIIALMAGRYQKRQMELYEAVSKASYQWAWSPLRFLHDDSPQFNEEETAWNQLVDMYNAGMGLYEEEKFDAAYQSFLSTENARLNSWDLKDPRVDDGKLSSADPPGDISPESWKNWRDMRLYLLYAQGVSAFYNTTLTQDNTNGRMYASSKHDKILSIDPEFYGRPEITSPSLMDILEYDIDPVVNSPRMIGPAMSLNLIVGAQRIKVTNGKSISLGTLAKGSTAVVCKLEIRNTGDSTLLLSALQGVSLTPKGTLPATLEPSKTVTREFKAITTTIGNKNGSIKFSSNAPGQEEISIPITYAVSADLPQNVSTVNPSQLLVQLAQESVGITLTGDKTLNVSTFGYNTDSPPVFILSRLTPGDPIEIRRIRIGGDFPYLSLSQKPDRAAPFPLVWRAKFDTFEYVYVRVNQDMMRSRRITGPITFPLIITTNENGSTELTYQVKMDVVEAKLDPTLQGILDGMIRVTGGSFSMGCDEPKFCMDASALPVHTVSVGNFEISDHEVTVGEWVAVMGSAPAGQGSCLNCAVGNVSFNLAVEFINKLNAMDIGLAFRLPTEAEWEYAARGGRLSKGYNFAGSNVSDEVAFASGGAALKPSGKLSGRKPNELGIYDMSGNALEWCADGYEPYGGSNTPMQLGTPTERVQRGGAANDKMEYLTVFARQHAKPTAKEATFGFRLAAK